MSHATLAQAEHIQQLVRYLNLDASKYRTSDFDEASKFIAELKAYREHAWRGMPLTDGTRQAVVMRMREQGVRKEDLYHVANVVSLGREGGATEAQGQALLRHLSGEEVHQEARDPNPPQRTIASIPPAMRRSMRPGLVQIMLAAKPLPPAPPEPVRTIVNPPVVARPEPGAGPRQVGRPIRGRPGMLGTAPVPAPVVAKPMEPEPEPDDVSFHSGGGRISGRATDGADGDHASGPASADASGGVPGIPADQASRDLDGDARRLDQAAVLNAAVTQVAVDAFMTAFPGATISEFTPCS